MTRRAAQLGISRSQFATAARSYLDELDSTSVITQIDAVLHDAGVDDSGDSAVAAGRARLAAENEW